MLAMDVVDAEMTMGKGNTVKLVSRYDEQDKQDIYNEIKRALVEAKVIGKNQTIDENFSFTAYDYTVWMKHLKPIMEKQAQRFSVRKNSSAQTSTITSGQMLEELLPKVWAQVFPNAKKGKVPYQVTELQKQNLNKNFEGVSGFFKKVGQDTKEIFTEVVNEAKESAGDIQDLCTNLAESTLHAVIASHPTAFKFITDKCTDFASGDERTDPIIKYIIKLYLEFKRAGYDISLVPEEQTDKRAKSLQEAGEAARKLCGVLLECVTQLKDSDTNKNNEYNEQQFYKDCYFATAFFAPDIISDSANTGLLNNLLAYTNALFEWLKVKIFSWNPETCSPLIAASERKGTEDYERGILIKTSVQGLSSATKGFKGTLFAMANPPATKVESNQNKYSL